MSIQNILKKKNVSIWGFGYLGYTAALKMQEHGFNVKIFDYDPNRFSAFEKRQYPGINQRNHWSLMNSIPDLDREKITFCTKPEPMFVDSMIHLIAVPIIDKGKAKGLNLKDLAKIFVNNVSPDTVVFFQAFGVPGQIDELFCQPLKEAGTPCHIVTAFRSDWVLEEFQINTRPQMLSANSAGDLEKAREFFDLLDIPSETLGSIKEAEVFENAKNALNYATTALVNQLALAYPSIDFQKVTKSLLKHVDLSTCQLSIGPGGYRMPFSVDALLAGSDMPECLSILKEAASVNFSTVLCYSEYLARKNHKAVLILGITNRENQKDLMAISPSLTLAETLKDRGLRIFLHDPHYSPAELNKLAPFCEAVSLESLPAELDAVIVMSAHSQYRYLSQDQLDAIISPGVKLIIDSTGIFSDYHFKHARYHQVGDGKINILK
jgi:UDP-N-acetyl-D-mannosaminuronate dehydrogenase